LIIQLPCTTNDDDDKLFSIYNPNDEQICFNDNECESNSSGEQHSTKGEVIRHPVNRNQEPIKILVKDPNEKKLFEQTLKFHDGFTTENAQGVLKQLEKDKKIKITGSQFFITELTEDRKHEAFMKAEFKRPAKSILAHQFGPTREIAKAMCQIDLIQSLYNVGSLSEASVEFHRDKKVLIDPELKLEKQMQELLATDTKTFAKTIDRLQFQ